MWRVLLEWLGQECGYKIASGRALLIVIETTATVWLLSFVESDW